MSVAALMEKGVSRPFMPVADMTLTLTSIFPTTSGHCHHMLQQTTIGGGPKGQTTMKSIMYRFNG